MAAQCYTRARTTLACASVALSRCGLRCDVAKLASFDTAFFLADRSLTLCCNTGTEHCFVHLYLIDDRPSCTAVACRSDVASLTLALMHGREFARPFLSERLCRPRASRTLVGVSVTLNCSTSATTPELPANADDGNPRLRALRSLAIMIVYRLDCER